MSVDISKINSALIIICGIVLFLVMILFFFIVLYRKRHNYFLKEKELLKMQYEQMILQAQVEIQEQTFTQISQEIHDNIGQTLSLARLNINTLHPDTFDEKRDSTDKLIGQAIMDLRHLSHSLNTTHIKDLGLVESVRQLLTSLQRTGQFQITFMSNVLSATLEDEKVVVLYRIIQESISNIIKHAEASTIDVQIKSLHSEWQISIKDNGKGFEKEEGIEKGLGLNNMLHRAEMIDFNMTLSSNPGKGTVIYLISKTKLIG